MKKNKLIINIVVLVLVFFLFSCGEKKGLIDYMTLLQRFSHKLSLSIDAKNQDLSNFYLHEIEEIIEGLDEIEYYHEVPVRKLNQALLEPSFKKLRKKVKKGDWESSNQKMNAMIETCNQCHRSSGFDYLKIIRTDKNPFMQSFKP